MSSTSFASQFEPGEEYKHFEFPTTPPSPAGGHADLVTQDGVEVGTSSLAVYSYYYREMISHPSSTRTGQIGNEVVVHWGDHGGRIKAIRATVERFPYLDLPTNKDYDLDAVPSGVAVRLRIQAASPQASTRPSQSRPYGRRTSCQLRRPTPSNRILTCWRSWGCRPE